MLGSFSALLCGFSVLHWHGVSLSGSYVLRCRVCFRRIFCSHAGHVVFSSFGKVSDDTLGSFSVLLCGFSVLHWHGVSGAMFYGLSCLVFGVFSSLAGHVVFSSFGKVSDDTLGSFSVLLCSFSVLHWHGVSGAMFYGLSCLVFGVFSSLAGHVVFSSFGKVSDDTLGSFSILLCGFSVGPSLAFFGLPCLVLGVLCSRAGHVVFSF